MIELHAFLYAKPWWTSRYMWGIAAAEALVLDTVFHSRFSMAGWDLAEVLA